MEELRSTEILDKEIREEARRKAEKILKEAEIDCREIGQKTEARFAEDEQQQKAEYFWVVLQFRHLNTGLVLQKTYLLSKFLK